MSDGVAGVAPQSKIAANSETAKRFMAFTVRFSDDRGWLEFSQPHTVLRSGSAEGLKTVLTSAEAALAEGLWIAGLIPYDRSGAAIGVFEAPFLRDSFETRPFALSPLLHTVSRDEYRRAIATIQRAIYDGDVYQVNYTVPFDVALEGDALSCWFGFAQRTRARYQAYVEDADRRVLSWSPELFLAFDGPTVQTRPMKGTSPPDDVRSLHDAKNRAEHVMIVDLLRNDLHRICDDVRVSALCAIERYPTFATMTSTIEGCLRSGVTLYEVFNAAFPCGSVTGAPKRAAMEMIASLETHSRGAYCGAIGYLSPQRRGWWNVAIRTAQFDGERGRFDAGGGIVSDSDADAEWDEVGVKRAFLRSDTFQLWETFAGDAAPDVLYLHVERLASAAERLEISFDRAQLQRLLTGAMQPATIVRVRLSLEGEMIVLSDPLAEPPDLVDVRMSAARVRSDDPWLQIKSSWRPAHREAWAEAQQHGCFDALLRNERGEVTEGSRTNLFIQSGDALVTPPRESGVLPGILRAKLIGDRRAVERVLYEHDLHAADAIYVGNSARGLLRARLQS